MGACILTGKAAAGISIEDIKLKYSEATELGPYSQNQALCSLNGKKVIAVYFTGTFILSDYDVPYTKYIQLADGTNVEMNNNTGTFEFFSADPTNPRGLWYNDKMYKDKLINLTSVKFYGDDGYHNWAMNITAYID